MAPIIKDNSVIDVSATVYGLLLLTARNLLAMGEDTRGELGAGAGNIYVNCPTFDNGGDRNYEKIVSRDDYTFIYRTQDKTGLTTAEIVAIVVGTLALVLVIIGIVLLVWIRKAKHKSKKYELVDSKELQIVQDDGW